MPKTRSQCRILAALVGPVYLPAIVLIVRANVASVANLRNLATH